jgi:hypothetical protein
MDNFALIGASAMLGGMARMTISLTVIVLECTGGFTIRPKGLPIMVCVIRWVGNLSNEACTTCIHFTTLPFLNLIHRFIARFRRVWNIAQENVVTLPHVRGVPKGHDRLGINTRVFHVVNDVDSKSLRAYFASICGVLLQKKKILQRPNQKSKGTFGNRRKYRFYTINRTRYRIEILSRRVRGIRRWGFEIQDERV